jgi:hypothetical protein
MLLLPTLVIVIGWALVYWLEAGNSASVTDGPQDALGGPTQPDSLRTYPSGGPSPVLTGTGLQARRMDGPGQSDVTWLAPGDWTSRN